MSERKHSERITIIKHGGATARESRSNKENVGGDKKINKNLFANTNEVDTKRENKRESLGILQDSCLDENELNFITKTDSVERYFTSLYDINKMNLGVPSVKDHFNISSTLNEHHNVENINQMPKHFSFDKLYNDEFITKNLKNLLYNHNRQIIWNTFQTLNDNLNLDITENMILKRERIEK